MDGSELHDEAIEYQLSREILRKLNLALKVDNNEDRNIICSEIFNDVAGDINQQAKAALHIRGARSYYEVLAPYHCKNSDAAEALLWSCRQLWSQPYIVPTYALLLHQWVLQTTGSRVSNLLNVLIDGVKQLFELDIGRGTSRFATLFRNVYSWVTAGNFQQSRWRTHSHDALLRLTAAYTPYYKDPAIVRSALFVLPPLQSGRSAASNSFHSYVVNEIAGLLLVIPSVKGLMRYLEGLKPVVKHSSEWRSGLSVVTLLRLENALYSLTLPGGPRYYPGHVRKCALSLLNEAFPTGSNSRGIVRYLFRLMHPSDWPSLAHFAFKSKFIWIQTKVSGFVSALRGLFAARSTA